MTRRHYENGNRWRKVSARVKARHDDCGICHRPIDYTLPHSDPMSFEVDHIIPVAIRPDLKYEPTNLQASHRICNRVKSDHVATVRDDAPLPHSRDWRAV